MRRFARGIAALAAIPLIGAGGGAAEDAPPPSAGEAARLAAPVVRTSIASQRIYFVMPDRYANGDPTNDRGGRSGPRGTTGLDAADPGWYHGGDLRGLTGDCDDTRRGLARLRDLGFTAIWITPPFRQKFVQGSSAAYHGYWILDFTTVDPHLGTEADFRAFVDCAHRLRLKVYLDVVVNHTADVILPTGGPRWVPPSEAPYRDCRGRRFDPARYAGTRRFPCLRAATMPRPPLVPAPERRSKRPAWLNVVTRYHNRGDVDFDSCSELCFEQGDFFGLDDLFTEQPAVVDGLARVYGDWVRRYRIDGFRIDTARHVDRAFFRVWVPRIRAAARSAGVRDFELFGEVFVANAIDVSEFVRERGLPNVIDFAMQDALAGYAGGDASARAIASRLADDDYYHRGRVAHTPPTFLGNHDMGRAALKIKERSRASGDVLLRRTLLGHSLLYLLRGAPVVYYGDEVGMVGRGGDQQARQDMFPTQVAEWRTQERAGSGPIGTASSFDLVRHPVADHLRVLGRLRDEHPALSTGASAVRLARGPVLAVSRIDLQRRREYVAAFNAGPGAARASFATATPSSRWSVVFGPGGAARSGAGGRLTVTLPPLSAVLLRADVALRARPPTRPRLSVGADELTDLRRVQARVGAGPATVSFAVRRGRGGWRLLAADDSAPYRAFLDPRRFRRGERVHLVAIARALDGRVAVSPVVPFVVRRR